MGSEGGPGVMGAGQPLDSPHPDLSSSPILGRQRGPGICVCWGLHAPSLDSGVRDTRAAGYQESADSLTRSSWSPGRADCRGFATPAWSVWTGGGGLWVSTGPSSALHQAGGFSSLASSLGRRSVPTVVPLEPDPAPPAVLGEAAGP